MLAVTCAAYDKSTVYFRPVLQAFKGYACIAETAALNNALSMGVCLCFMHDGTAVKSVPGLAGALVCVSCMTALQSLPGLAAGQLTRRRQRTHGLWQRP